MKIKQANLSDLEQLAVLFDLYRVFYRKKTDLAAAKKFLTARIQQEESIIYVAEDEQGKLAGFVQLYPLFSSTRMKRMWLLNDLFVHKNFRGQGISKLLIQSCKAYAKATNACGLSLETEKSNIIGNQLYPIENFELDTEHNYYFWAVE